VNVARQETAATDASCTEARAQHTGKRTHGIQK